MQISEIDQEISDFDWFAIDCNGYVVHFSSGGNQLPHSVAASKESLDLLQHYFLSLPILFSKTEIFVAPTNTPFPYLAYARRGLFSYEAIQYAWPMHTSYELTARPLRALALANLPAEIAELVSKTQLGFSIIGLVSLDTEMVA